MKPRETRLAVSSVLASGAVLSCLSAGLPAHAGAFYIQEQSTRGAGRAFSGEVADTGPESLWWNPAAIASSPAQAYGSISGIFPHGNVYDDGSTITRPIPPNGLTTLVGGDAHAYGPIKSGPAAGGGVAIPIGDRFAVGLSLASPFELETKYSGNSFARYDALKSRLDSADIQLTGAVKAASWVDFGAGVDGVYTSARLTQASPNLSPLLPDGVSNVTGDGWNAGWNVGAQFHPADKDAKWNVGVSYRSAVGRNLSGDVVVSGLLGPLAPFNTVTHGSAKFTTPWIAIAGTRYHVSPKLTLNLQLQRIGWSEFRNIEISFPGVSQVIPQNYRDTTTEAFGADYSPNPLVTFRVGAQHDPTPTPDVGRSLRVPDADRWLISGGGELTLGRHLTVEGAIEYVDFLGSHVDRQDAFYAGTPAQTAVNYTATVDGDAFIVSGGARWRF